MVNYPNLKLNFQKMPNYENIYKNSMIWGFGDFKNSSLYKKYLISNPFFVSARESGIHRKSFSRFMPP